MNQYDKISAGREVVESDSGSGDISPFAEPSSEKISSPPVGKNMDKGIRESEIGSPVVPVVDTLSGQEKKGAEDPLLDEFDVLEEAIVEIINERLEPVSLNIRNILEEHRIVLGEKYGALFEEHEKIALAINEISDEDDLLSDEIEQSPKILSEHLKTKSALKARLEGLSQGLLLLEEKVKESIATAEKSETKSATEQNLERPLSKVEQKIGAEKYEALSSFVGDAWQGLQASIHNKEKSVPVADRNTVWGQAFLPLLKEEIHNFLQEQTDFEADEYEMVMHDLITKKGLPVKRILSKQR